jgi:Ser/Thr protein kinase RdoA (MazF antagonist)
MLCINDYGPGSVRLAKGDDVAIIHWDFAGTNTRTWEIGGMLNGWSLGHDGSVNEVAVRALIAGYRQNATVTPELELSIFTPAICGHLNWLSGRISRALARDDEELRRREELELRDLLSHPRRRSDFERIIAVASE